METIHHHHHEEHEHEHEHDHRKETIFAWIRVAILLGMGLYFTWNILSGNLTNYINVRFAWLSYLAAGLFYLLAFTSAWRAWKGSHDHNHHHEGHDHGNMSVWMLVIVAVPLLIGTLIPSRPLGAEAIDGNISYSSIAVTDTNVFDVSPENRNILDWLRLFNTTDDITSFNGQEAKLVGFIYREPDMPDEHFVTARFTISCCVADSTSIGLPVHWSNEDDLPEGEWVEVTGTFEAGDFRDLTMPILQASKVEVIEQPAHPYLYP